MRLHLSLRMEELHAKPRRGAMHVKRIRVISALDLWVVRQSTSGEVVADREPWERATEHVRERELPPRHPSGDRGRGKHEEVGCSVWRIREDVAKRDEPAHGVAVQDDR